MNDFSDSMSRIRGYLRACQDAARGGNFPAAILSAQTIGELIQLELVPAFKAEQQRRASLEERHK
jgi:hypothetical protein